MGSNEVSMEQIVMELVVNSGTARSMAMAAIEEGAQGNFEAADEQLEAAKNQIAKAHEFQTELIAQEAGGNPQKVSLIMVHGQDHLMTAMVVIDLAEKMIQLYKKINK